MGKGADIIKKLTPAPIPTFNAWHTIGTDNLIRTERDESAPNVSVFSKENTTGCEERLESAKQELFGRERNLVTVKASINSASNTDRGELVCVGENTTVVRPRFKNKTWSRKDATSTIKGRSRRRTTTHTALHPNAGYPKVTMTNDLFGGYAFGNVELMPPTYSPICVNNSMPMPMPTHIPGPIPMMGHKSEGYGVPQGNVPEPFMALPPSPMNPYFHQLSPSPPIDMFQIPFHPYYHPVHSRIDPMPNLYRIHEIKNQVLYYFSPENMNTDNYLKSLIDRRSGGVLLTELIKFKRLNLMTNNGRDIVILQDIIKYECFPELELIHMDQGVGVRNKYWKNGIK